MRRQSKYGVNDLFDIAWKRMKKKHYERKYCIFNGETLTVLIDCYILYII